MLLLFTLIAFSNCPFLNSISYATYDKESFLNWSPYTIRDECPIFFHGQVGMSGLGDELEHLIYFLNVAKTLEASLILDGGLTAGSSSKKHIGSMSYNKVAEILGANYQHNLSSIFARYGPLTEKYLTFPEVLEFKKALLAGTERLPCRTIIRSYIESCDGGWCPVVYPEHNFVKNVNWILRNNSAKQYCHQSNLGFPMKSESKETSKEVQKKKKSINVVWHVRTGDLALHRNVIYYDVLLRTLLDGIEMTRKDIGHKLQLVFESQEKVPFLENEFPAARFNIGKDIFSSVCTFLTSDIFISSGSTFAVVLGFAQQPRHPIIFEEVRKEVIWGDFSKKHTLRQRHIFTKDDAILLDEGKPLMRKEDVQRLLKTVLYK